MKKILGKITLVILITGVVIQMLSPIGNVSAARKTLSYYEQLVEKYEQEARDNKNAIKKTEEEIAYSKNRIEELKKETLQLSDEIKKLNQEIDEYEEDIKDKLAESKQVLEYMQIVSGKNIYLDYVFKADSVTDLINRSYVVKEIVDYNTKMISDLEQIIKDNEEREKEIDKRKKTITSKEKELEKNIETLGEKKTSLSAGGVTIEDDLKNAREYVNMYKKLGCKSNDVIGVDCAVPGSGTSVFRRPTKTGYVTQEAYYGSSYTHRAIDIGSYNKTKEKIYPIASGTITAKYYDNYGALCLAIEHYNITDGRYYTSLYVHMSSYAPNLYVGKKVTSDDYIGYMGETGYAFGVHLHMEVFPCRLYNPGDENCSTWSKWDAFAKKQLRNGYNPRKLISFPSGTYNSWYSR